MVASVAASLMVDTISPDQQHDIQRLALASWQYQQERAREQEFLSRVQITCGVALQSNSESCLH
jgi:hypothetical protein